jgi:hypothetical protein
MKIIFLMITFLVSYSVSLAAPTSVEECGSVDLRYQVNLKMRNQRSLAWCFAHAAADNLQYTDRALEQVSAADIAIHYAKSSSSKFINLFQSDSDDDSPRQFGLSKFASEMIVKEGGYCPERYLPSDEWSKINRDGESVMVEIRQATREIQQLLGQVKKKEIISASELPFYYSFLDINKEQFFNLLLKSKSDDLYEDLRVLACQNHRVPFHSKLKFSMYLFNLVSHMNKSLDKNKSFTIDVYNQIFRNIDADGSGLGNLHTVLVYGRRYNTSLNQCQYLVKNSYGENCGGYDPRLECDKGYFWFPETTLKKNMISAVFND